MVASLLKFKAQIDRIIIGPFSVPTSHGNGPDRDRVLTEAANSAFASGMAKRRNKPAEMIGSVVHLHESSFFISSSSVIDR